MDTFSRLARPEEAISSLVEYPEMVGEMTSANWIEEDLRAPGSEMRYIPRENTFIEIWPHAVSMPRRYPMRNLKARTEF
jgi:hypothetical protein